MGKINVAVLMGGKSGEREVSLSTGRMIMGALNPDRYNAYAVDTALCGQRSLTSAQTGIPSTSDANSSMMPLDDVISPNGSRSHPDVAFIALHGKYGEDGTVQGLLELLGIPYVGSGVLSSALAMDKVMTRKIMEYEGIPVPKGFRVERSVDTQAVTKRILDEIGLPAVVKPSKQGSTIGLSIVRIPSDIPAAVDLAFKHDDDVLVEEFIEGIEITGPVLGNEDAVALPLVEIVPAGGFYDYHSKYTPGATEEIVPARIPESQYRQAEELSLACHKILGCRDMSRTDMIVRGDDAYVLEVNTIPGMTPTSLLPRSAQAAGIEFPDLLDRLIDFALRRR